FLPDMKGGLGGLMEAMAPLEEAAKDAGKSLRDAFTWVKDNWSWIEPFAVGIGIATGAILAITAATWAWNAALAVNPIFLIIAAIGVLIGAIIWLVQNWDVAVAFVKSIWTGFGLWLREAIIGLLGWWESIWTEFGNFINDMWSAIAGSVAAYINRVSSVITTVVLAISGLWQRIWTEMGNFFSDRWRQIVSAVEFVRTAFRVAFAAIKGFIVGAFESAVRTVKNAINGIIGLINRAIRGNNGLICTVGGAFGLMDSIPPFPRLVEGALIGSSRGGSLVNLGEVRFNQ